MGFSSQMSAVLEADMPFDDARVSAEREPVLSASVAMSAPRIVGEGAFDLKMRRRKRIERVVDIVAAILFGALGAFAGAAVVVLMLVALVIPTTTSLALAIGTVTLMVVGIAIWLKQRASDRARNADPIRMDYPLGAPA